MTLDQFCDLMRSRIPTPDEFIDFVEGQKWRIDLRDDGTAALKEHRMDPLAVKLAAMLRREPYRTNVIARLRERLAATPKQESPPPLKVYEPPDPEPPAFRQREFLTPVGGTVRGGSPQEGWPDDHVPLGAWWWRFVGEAEWQLTAEGHQAGAGYPPTRAPILKGVPRA